MPRPTLFTHPKFRRLCYELKMPEPYVLGHLEYLWAVGYESGSDSIGDSLDVELAARWQGERGVFTQALLASGFLDEAEEGLLSIHDLHDHAPEYVRRRFDREHARRLAGKTLRDLRVEAGRLGAAAMRASGGGQMAGKREASGGHVRTREGANDSTPAPAPAPSSQLPAPAPKGGVGGAEPEPEEEADAGAPAREAAPRSREPKTVSLRPPAVEEIRAEVARRGLHVDADAFLAYYTANGWKVGRNPMKSWQAALTTWERNGFGNDRRSSAPSETGFDTARPVGTYYADNTPAVKGI